MIYYHGLSIFLEQQHGNTFEYLVQTLAQAQSGNVIEKFFEYLPQIIHEAGQTILAFASLLFAGAVLIILIFFRHDSLKVRLSVFLTATPSPFRL